MNTSKKKKHMITIVLLLITLLNSRCDKPPLAEEFFDITIINNSGNSICAFLADKQSSTQYPDTSLPINKPALQIMAPGNNSYHYSRDHWSKELEYLPADTLAIFILDAKIYRDSSWSYIRDNYKILKRYDLSIKNLEELNFYVSYPATLEMKDIKMYPK